MTDRVCTHPCGQPPRIRGISPITPPRMSESWSRHRTLRAGAAGRPDGPVTVWPRSARDETVRPRSDGAWCRSVPVDQGQRPPVAQSGREAQPPDTSVCRSRAVRGPQSSVPPSERTLRTTPSSPKFVNENSNDAPSEPIAADSTPSPAVGTTAPPVSPMRTVKPSRSQPGNDSSSSGATSCGPLHTGFGSATSGGLAYPRPAHIP